MASPADLEDFALGFGLTEGLLASPQELYGTEQREVAEGIELHLEVSSACELLFTYLRPYFLFF